jgi:hypothetical protein
MNTQLQGPELHVAITVVDLIGFMAITITGAVIGAVAVHFKDYPKYRKTWKALADNIVTLEPMTSYGSISVFCTDEVKVVMRRVMTGHLSLADYHIKDQGTVRYYADTGTITLIGGGVMLKDFASYLDPYHLIWRVRITRLITRLASAQDPRAVTRDLKISRVLDRL